MPTAQMLPDSALSKVAVLTLNMAQNAGTYDVGTVSGGDILIENVAPFVAVAAASLTSVALNTNNTTADALLAATALANLTALKNLTPFTNRIFLGSGKKIQATIVGNGTGAGSMKVVVTYRPLAQGAIIS